ncbi:18537_t:CDS:2 [Funneliformis geosporum]|uniref:1062_t:CDS:1 n=1 Tax=Funneliformis geosporum TaxID=1117311 RepID=A0A9W4SP18_9GLOM|nr:18537_t:CDS:2 [Funneliformis geosporum]CAI2176189.1 1062_t:CDS:2 [Funneliformis geosporum]
MGQAFAKSIKEAAMAKLEIERERMKLEHESNTANTEMKIKEMEKSLILEERKLDMEHQHKISELFTEMKLAKFQVGKELILTYMQTVNNIIEQNGKVFVAANSMMNTITNEKMPQGVRDAASIALERAFNGYMDATQLLEYAKKEIDRLDLKKEYEFKKLLGVAEEHNLLSGDDSSYLLE